MNSTQQTDPAIYDLILKEEQRQTEGLELIASENYASTAVQWVQSTVLTNKYAEGYPGKRYYGGCEFVDGVESLAIQRACELFNADHANVQPHSGSNANMAVFMANLAPGDTFLGMDLSHGGHLTHGSSVNFSGKLYQAQFYGLNETTHLIDYDQIRDQALKHKPKMIIAGFSAYPRALDFKIFKSICDEVGAVLLVDMAHIAGLVASGHHESPFPHADFVTTTTHKTLRGPRGGLILCKDQYKKKLNSRIFPGIQGGPLEHVIGAKAVCFQEALQPEFKTYIGQVLKNSKALAQELASLEYHLVTGGTDNHLLLIDLTNKSITGKEAEEALDLAGITVNKNTVPGEKLSPFVTSGIRIGTPAVTTRGFQEQEIKRVAHWIDEALKNKDKPEVLSRIKAEIKEMTKSFPIPVV